MEAGRLKKYRNRISSVLVLALTAAVLGLLAAGAASGRIGLSPLPEAHGIPVSPGNPADPHPSGPVHEPEPTDPASGSLASDQTVRNGATVPESGSKHGVRSARLLRCMHYNENDFMRSVNDRSPASDSLFEINEDPGTGPIMGGIVPHHLLARRLIADFFRTLAVDPPQTVIVAGPNHKLEGISKIQFSSADWGTPFGILEADTRITARLAEEYGAAHNDDLFENEHSVSSLVPYIKYFLPEAKIVPVLLHGSLSPEEARKLGSLLGGIISDNPGTVMIASIDFSHYLSAPEADEMDMITWKAVSSWDLDSISRMGNDNLDSVPSMTALMTAMDAVSAKDIRMKGHNNSSRITKSGYDYTTSYFTMFFRKHGQDSTLP